MPTAAEAPLDFVGNDIVDLAEPEIARHHLRERFLDKVCAASERDALRRADSPQRCLWALFAAKEAAFKLAVKRLGPIAFAHRRFLVAPDWRSVSYGSHRWWLQLEAGPDWVHALVTSSAWPERVSYRVARSGSELASAGARQLLRELAADAVGCQKSELSIERPHAPGYWDGLGPPELLRGTERTATDVSLSHDGRFVAAALLVRGTYLPRPREASRAR